jgi:hypothetical protein
MDITLFISALFAVTRTDSNSPSTSRCNVRSMSIGICYLLCAFFNKRGEWCFMLRLQVVMRQVFAAIPDVVNFNVTVL